MPKAQETVLEIDLKAVKHNFQYLKSKLNPNTKFLAVVKAFAYGNDAEEIAVYLERLDVDYFAVAYAKEGVSLRQAGVTKPILVLHPQVANFKTIIDYCLEPGIYSTKILTAFLELAKAENQVDYPIHLKFNTGLNRLGFLPNDIDFIFNNLSKTTSVKIKSVFSHLAASEDLNEKEYTLNQISRFKDISEQFKNRLDDTPLFHLCNTSGILNYPEAHFDMVRSGIGLYGFGNSPKESKNLKPIASLKTIISQIHTLEQGGSVGYNRAYKSDTPLRTATLPIGHADGMNRIYGKEKGYVFINGKKAPIIGNTCMDMIMVNVTDIACEEGDEVIIFDATHTAEQLAENAHTISYELITSISQRVKRVVVR